MSVFSPDLHPQVRDASADERLPRDAIRLAGPLVYVENQPASRVMDQEGVVNEFAEAVVFVQLQDISRS
jgi:hypothetical protein